jgi:hypothetical protein
MPQLHPVSIPERNPQPRNIVFRDSAPMALIEGITKERKL